jgi:co-chaperonin GroES (HSP10)
MSTRALPTMLPPAEDIKGVLRPTGFKVLVFVPPMEQKMRSGLYRTERNRELEETAQVIAQVIELGPEAYKDDKRFPSGAYCKPGDFVVLRPYSGTRFIRNDTPYEYRLVNDDSIEAVLADEADPTEIARAS